MGSLSDQDLIILAGNTAYYNKFVDKEITVIPDVGTFIVLDTTTKDSGLNALTLQNTTTKEITIVYQGTDTTQVPDITTDLSLPGTVPNNQLEDAEKYFIDQSKAYANQMNGNEIAVCGNSLGGALANQVAVNHPEIRSVTLNPAILPGDLKGNHDNITNYMSDGDILTKGEKALGMGGQIPGKHVDINTSLPGFSNIAPNHMGYINDKDDPTAQHDVVINGVSVPFGADRFLPVSIWGDTILEATFTPTGKKIKIDTQALRILKQKMNNLIIENIKVAQSCLDNSTDLVESEGVKIDDRKQRLEVGLDEMLASTWFGRLLLGQGSLQQFEEELSPLGTVSGLVLEVLDSIRSLPLISTIIDYSIGTALHINPLAGISLILVDTFADVEEFLRRLAKVKREDIPKLLNGIDNSFVDAVVEELQGYYQIVDTNKELLTTQGLDFGEKVGELATAMEEADKLYESGDTPPAITLPPVVQVTLDQNSSYLKVNPLQSQQNTLDNNCEEFAKAASNYLRPVLESLASKLNQISMAIDTAVAELNVGIVGLGTLKNNNLFFLLSITGTIDNAQDFLRTKISEIQDIQLSVDGAHAATKNLQDNLYDLLKAYRPFIESALFEGTKLLSVMQFNKEAWNIYTNMEVVFRDIQYQLSENESKAVDAMSNVARDFGENLLIMADQIKRGSLDFV
ncbi:hypothetical protein HCA73_15930 [Listeria booriae]|uniref:SA1320 family protein n=1 Tax=Listeria booriae TaxID=1552123 RepID=UPI001628A73E|nr:YqiA/YcfP family alpha/beta fold hydrolase [Listeria booriae]MBC1914141.1 hypothetical protein [Listeria booriae]